MSTIALELIASMIKSGDLGPIHRGEFRREHCTDGGAEHLFDFLHDYKRITGGVGRVPPMSVVLDRFPHIILPQVSDFIDMPALVHEARAYKTKLKVQALAAKVAAAINAVDPIGEIRGIRSEFDVIMKEASSTRDLSFTESAMEILDSYTAKDILKQGIPWPWQVLNEATQGLHPGEFYVIAGRPKSRKTFVALYIAAFLLKYHNQRILFISPEMPERQVMLRFMAFVATVPYAPFKRGDLVLSEEDKLFEIIGTLLDEIRGVLAPGFTTFARPNMITSPGSEPTFVVVKATAQPVSFIESKIQEHRPTVVIVDSFYRLGSSAAGAKSYDSDWKAVSSSSRMLKDMAMEHDVALIGTHQLNRDADEKIGTLANMGYSDAIGQDCDLAIRVITQRKKTGDRSALLILGARETDVEGVLIHNEPCNNFGQIEALLPGNRKKLLEMLSEENEEDAKEEKKASPTDGKPPNFKAAHFGNIGKKASPHIPMAEADIEQITPDELRKSVSDIAKEVAGG